MKSEALALSLAAICLVVSSPAALAKQQTQASSEWSTVMTVSPGEKLVVKMKDGKKFEGSVVSLSDGRLTLSDRGKTTEIERAHVRQVYRVIPKSVAKSTGRATAMGTAIGFAGGATAGLIMGNYEDITTAGAVGILGGLGAGIGAAIGAVSGLFSSTGKDKVLIYESK